ncbi:MAG: four helix bundle protein [Mangrovibacterium sp.]
MIKDYKELIVWQKAMDATVEIYRLVKLLPKEETYALSDQMRRAAVSIPSNIAEGQSRNSSKDYARFLAMAKGSRAELETQLLLCVRVGYLTNDDISVVIDLLSEISKIINAIQRKLTPPPSSLLPLP